MATSDSDSRRSRERNVAMARRGFEAWMAGDVEGALAVLSPEIEIYVPQELGNAGTFHGHEGFQRWVGQWVEVWSEFSYDIREMVPVGEHHVVAQIYNKGRGRGSGVEVEQTLGWIFDVRDDLCAYLCLRPSFEEALELAWEREAAAKQS